MGHGWTKLRLVEPFGEFQQWDHYRALEIIGVFKDNEFDFGVDVDVVAALLEGDRDTARQIIERLAPNGGAVINGLAFLGGVALVVAAGPKGMDAVSAKCGLVFDVFDLEGRQRLSKDELTIALLSCLRALTGMLGCGTPPADAEVEQLVNQAYAARSKDYGAFCTKDEFYDIVSAHIGDDCSSLGGVLRGFGVADLDELAAAVDVDEDLAAAKLQARVRGRNERLHPTKPPRPRSAGAAAPPAEEDLAASKLQARVRGRNERLHPTKPPAKARPASAGARPTAAEPDEDVAATTLQARIRGRASRAPPRVRPSSAPSARPGDEPDPEQDLAAARLQARIRGRNERLHPTPPPTKRPASAGAAPAAAEEDLAAAKLQARVRGRNERLHPTPPPTKRPASAGAAPPPVEEDAAATKLQARIRGRASRAPPRPSSAPAKRPEDAEQDVAASKLQARVRGRNARKR